MIGMKKQNENKTIMESFWGKATEIIQKKPLIINPYDKKNGKS